MNKSYNEIILSGTLLSPGIAIGKAFPYHDILTRDVSSYRISGMDVPYELRRISNAFGDVRKELYKLSRTISQTISSENGNIFEAQRLMIEDEEFSYSFEKEMRNELTNAEQVVKKVFQRQIERFGRSSSELIQARADDLRDIYRKVLRSLLGIETCILGDLPKHSVIVARRLLPSDTVRLDQKNVEGIIVQEGSIHAHSALLARSLGIPAFCTDDILLNQVRIGTTIIIDGSAKRGIVNPTAATMKKIERKKEISALEGKKRTRVIHSAVKTATGMTVNLFANTNTAEEAVSAIKSGCDGIGLLRTETIYLQSKGMPDEEELLERMNAIVAPMGDKPVTIRLLDIGGDKRLPYFEFEEEFSPFLGLRGVRLLLKNPALLKTQIRALLRLCTVRPIKILIPMVSIPEEITEVRRYVSQCMKDLGLNSGEVRLQTGTMVETPSAALHIDKIAAVSDFISIGTNDLIQYLMAASRENPNVSELYEKGFEYVLPLVERIAHICHESGKECCVCGEMANDEQHLEKLLRCGITQVSVASFRIPFLKNCVKNFKE